MFTKQLKEIRMLSLKRHHDEPGTAPGTLLAPKIKLLENTAVELIQFNEELCKDIVLENIDRSLSSANDNVITWINVSGLHDIELIREFGEQYNLHKLALEDLLNLGQRPKMEQYDDHLFVVFKMAKGQSPEQAEQVAMFIADKLLITFQEMQGDVFEPVKRRLRIGKNRLRKSGSDFLAYALIDQAVDELYPLLERYSEMIEEREEKMMDKPGREQLEDVDPLNGAYWHLNV
ncbi:MAG: magnesium transporter [Paraglaciecola sp.]|jgi:magnesium transporter